jgi:hypothetical protein
MTMWRQSLFSVVVLSAVMIAGCATTPTYHATVVKRAEGAVVGSWSSQSMWRIFSYYTYTEVEKVDGLSLSPWSQGWGGWLVDPGLRVLSVAGTYTGLAGARNTGRVEFKVFLKAGHTYLIKAERSGENIILWVEDQATQEAVTEKRSTKTTHWIRWL